ncbi:hypothetical protein FACS1894167_15500 [Synergistales bacterium]|nr:hypothetical protein FACS1894167_15500 [Synergistales bacterium]
MAVSLLSIKTRFLSLMAAAPGHDGRWNIMLLLLPTYSGVSAGEEDADQADVFFFALINKLKGVAVHDSQDFDRTGRGIRES